MRNRYLNRFFYFICLLFFPVLFLFSEGGGREPGARIKLSADLEVLEISENTWLHTSFLEMENYGRVPANGLLIVEKGEALLVDTPWNNTQSLTLYDWVKNTRGAVIKQVIITHTHVDCMGGLAALHERGVKSIAGGLTVKAAKEAGKQVPHKAFEVSLVLNLAEREVVCYYPGAGHTTDNIVVWLPGKKILFGGCLIKARNNRTLGNVDDADLDSWPGTLQKLKDRFPDVRTIIPGHGGIGGINLIEHTLKLFNKST